MLPRVFPELPMGKIKVMRFLTYGIILNNEDVVEFDKGFPQKEKQKLPGQIFQ